MTIWTVCLLISVRYWRSQDPAKVCYVVCEPMRWLILKYDSFSSESSPEYLSYVVL